MGRIFIVGKKESGKTWFLDALIGREPGGDYHTSASSDDSLVPVRAYVKDPVLGAQRHDDVTWPEPPLPENSKVEPKSSGPIKAEPGMTPSKVEHFQQSRRRRWTVYDFSTKNEHWMVPAVTLMPNTVVIVTVSIPDFFGSYFQMRDLRDLDKHFLQVVHWARYIQGHAPTCKLVVVGTMEDKLWDRQWTEAARNMAKAIDQRLHAESLEGIIICHPKYVIFPTSAKLKNGFDAVRLALETALPAETPQPEWDAIGQHLRKSERPTITLPQLLNECTELLGKDTNPDISKVMAYLRDLGIISYFEGNLALQNTVYISLDPILQAIANVLKWLAKPVDGAVSADNMKYFPTYTEDKVLALPLLLDVWSLAAKEQQEEGDAMAPVALARAQLDLLVKAGLMFVNKRKDQVDEVIVPATRKLSVISREWLPPGTYSSSFWTRWVTGKRLTDIATVIVIFDKKFTPLNVVHRLMSTISRDPSFGLSSAGISRYEIGLKTEDGREMSIREDESGAVLRILIDLDQEPEKRSEERQRVHAIIRTLQKALTVAMQEAPGNATFTFGAACRSEVKSRTASTTDLNGKPVTQLRVQNARERTYLNVEHLWWWFRDPSEVEEE